MHAMPLRRRSEQRRRLQILLQWISPWGLINLNCPTAVDGMINIFFIIFLIIK